MKTPRLTLRTKLVLAAGAFTLLTQALLLVFMAKSIDAAFELDTRQRITATSSMLNAALAPVVFRRDYAGARDLLEDILLRGTGNLDYVDIIDNRGLPFAQAGVERPGNMPSAGLPLDIKGAVFHGTAPLAIGDQPVGTVRFGLSRRVQLQSRNDLLLYGISLSAFAGLLMIAAFMLIGYFLTRDLKRLLQATRAVAAGDYDIDIRIASRDEVGDLARHFNGMVEVLRKTIAQLKERSDRFRNLSRLSSDWFWEQDEHFRFKDPEDVGSNQDFHARSPVGKTRWELESSNLTPEQWAEHRAVLERHEPFADFEFARTSADGQLRWISTSGEPIFDQHGRFTGYRGVGKDITERKIAEIRIRASEERLRATLDNTPGVAVQWFDRNGRVLFWNPASEKLYGITAEQAIGRTMLELLHTQEQYREFLELIRGVEATGQSVGPLEISIHSTANVDSTVMYNMFMLPGDENPIFVCMDVDITERKKSERALRESEARFRLLFEQAPVGMTLRGIDGGRLAVNDAMSRILGYSFEEMRTGTFEINHPDDAEQARQYRERMFAGQIDNYFHEKRYLRKDGSTIWVNFWATLIRDEHRQPLMRLSVVQDISARTQAEQALRESEERFRLLFEQAPVGMTLRSVDGARLAVNQALCSMLGYTFDELRSGEIKIIHPDFVDQATENRELMFEGGLDHYQYDTQCLRKDGTSFWINFWATLIRDAGQQPVMRLAVIQDISSRKQAEDEIRALNAGLEKRVAERTEELAMANKELEAFAYSVSHDLKAPLRGIDGYSRLLLDKYGDKLDAEGRRFLENVRKGTNSMHDLIEDLLTYSRIERGGRLLGRLDLRPLLGKLLEERLSAADATHCRINNTLPDFQVTADREGLMIALRNLLDNAIKFTGGAPGAVIDIGGRMEGASCILWVRDNGPGFDMKYHDRIFGMFERLHRSNEFPGTGIGLAIVQKAMTRMGGKVWAESEPGKGATFYLEIPA